MKITSCLFFLSGALAGCIPMDDTGTHSGTGTLTWYTTCGDPVCSGYHGPIDGVSDCTTEVEGASCDSEGAQCDPHDDCDALLVCATSDPKDQTGGCPISQRQYKQEIGRAHV